MLISGLFGSFKKLDHEIYRGNEDSSAGMHQESQRVLFKVLLGVLTNDSDSINHVIADAWQRWCMDQGLGDTMRCARLVSGGLPVGHVLRYRGWGDR